MPVLAEGIHRHTPTLTVVDPRGLAVRSVAYCRSAVGAQAEERINRSAHDPLGRLVKQWDPRLWRLSEQDAATPANLLNHYSLSGKVLGSTSVDAGERISLFGDGDQLIHTWDSRGSERRIEYDDLLRPLAIFEQGEGQTERCAERYEYADGRADFAARNQCGQLIRHDDPAGTRMLDEYALTGGVREQTQRFLLALDVPDWPLALPARDELLETPEQAATTLTQFNPLGDVITQTDARGNRQLFGYTFDGQLFMTRLGLKGQASPQILVNDIAYSAYGQVEQETAGNGVVSTLTYRPEDGRLMRLQARRSGEPALQDLRYDYDPVGNVLSIEDAALPIRYFANQRVEPVNRYAYDSLYQLIGATGWEAGSAGRGPGFNRFDNPGAVANYQQTYRYDAGGNLLELVHVGPQNHSRKLTAARYSNRCLRAEQDRPPTEEEIAAAFDGNGNLLELQPGQAMSWDLRNQLREVRPVEREGAEDDRELYLYGGDGLRRRKVRMIQAHARSLISEVRYLPGLEIRTQGTGEILQVISVQAGRSAMQVLHWETAPPSGIVNDQYRYNLTDHLGSSSLELSQELDGEVGVISRETYHPYGSTAWFAGRSEVEAGYKTVRYSGKERDTTGLYYYGFRYYSAWLQRWINPDPAGSVDGLNVYAFVQGTPINRIDENGLWGDDDRKLRYFRVNPPQSILERQNIESIAAKANQHVIAHGLDGFSPVEQIEVTNALFKAPLVLQKAQWMQQHQPELSESVLRDFFGPEHAQEHSTILESWARTENLLRQYHNSGFGRGKFVRSVGDAGSYAFVNRSDSKGHIFIGDRFMQSTQESNIVTLIHEVSHLTHVSQFAGVGSKAEDFYYILGSAGFGRRHAADIVVRGGMHLDDIKGTSEYFTAGVRGWEQNIVGAESIYWDEQVSISYHNANPGLRAYMAARNADSLAFAAQSLSNTFNSLYPRANMRPSM